MPENWAFPLFILAVLVFMGWFALGTQWNVRKGDAVLKWLRQGLPLVGERTTMRWLGSSVMEMNIAKAKDPFRTVDTLVAFEPRDVIFLWALARLQGRRDLLIIRSQLRAAPTFELEAFEPKGWTAPQRARLQGKDWSKLDGPSGQNLVVYYSGDARAQVKPLIDLASRAGVRLVRLSVRRTVPNLEVHWLLPAPGACSARDLFLKLRQMGEETLSGQ
jgi:hypothetical protein